MLPQTASATFGELFLHEPDLFPGRIGGEAWGTEELRLDIAGGPYRLRGLSTAMHAVFERRLAPRLLPLEAAAHGEVVISLFRAPLGDFRELYAEPWATSFELDHAAHSVRLAGFRVAGRIDAIERSDRSEPPSGAIWFPEPDSEATLAATIENFLRAVAAYRVAEQGGALLHSAGILVEGEAWLFVGRSGAGKSTLSRLSAERGYEILSDELNALWRKDGELVIERMPFAGELGQSAGARAWYPLAAVHTLRQGPEAARLPVSRAAALGELAAAAPYLNVDPLRNERLLTNLEHLLERCPVGQLTFRLDSSFWDLLRGAR